MSKPLIPLVGQPLCKYYTDASTENLTGDYSCKCLAGIPYDWFPSNMERWPCRRRHLLGLEQSVCDKKDYDTELTNDIDAQATEMVLNALK